MRPTNDNELSTRRATDNLHRAGRHTMRHHYETADRAAPNGWDCVEAGFESFENDDRELQFLMAPVIEYETTISRPRLTRVICRWTLLAFAGLMAFEFGWLLAIAIALNSFPVFMLMPLIACLLMLVCAWSIDTRA